MSVSSQSIAKSTALVCTHSAEGCSQYLGRRRRCSEAVPKKAQFRLCRPGEFADQQSLEDRHSLACLGRWSVHCSTSPPRPRPNGLGLCVSWVHEAHHGTDGQYCVLYNEYMVVPMRMKAGQQVHSSGLCPALAAGFVGDMEVGGAQMGGECRTESQVICCPTQPRGLC
jgi:hypothetical protein